MLALKLRADGVSVGVKGNLECKEFFCLRVFQLVVNYFFLIYVFTEYF